MSDSYQSVVYVWSQFPREFEMSTFNNDIKAWRDRFQNRIYLFDNYITKIILIGNVSSGKSTIINKFIGHDYFGAEEGHGTQSFFYCSLSETGYEYFTMNNSNEEISDISVLGHASHFSNNNSYEMNHDTILKVYVTHDENEILSRKTVIVDCPGFDRSERYNEEIAKHSSNADLFIFVFPIYEGVSVKQINYIKEIKRKFNNPTCFFVYNKCDLPEFNRNLQTNLRGYLYNLLGNQEVTSLTSNNEPLYFISALHPDRFTDFNRLKSDINIYKDSNFLRFSNFQSRLFEEANNFCRRLNHFVSDRRDEKTSLATRINEMIDHRNSNCVEIRNYVQARFKYCKRNLHIEKIFDIILGEINDYNRICYKENASQMIKTIEDNFSEKIIEFVENCLTNSCVNPINQKITVVNDSNNTNGIKIASDMEVEISTNLLVIPKYKNIENIFWFFEFGNKTMKIKEYYSEFIESISVKQIIKNSIENLYENEFSNIRIKYENLLETYERNCMRNESVLNENLRSLESNFKKLEAYEIGVRRNFERLQPASIN